jgi:MoaA/NifB/PqqE/SkfB family radical SAM enzyme
MPSESRTLQTKINGVQIYKSSFNPKTGMIVRETVEGLDDFDMTLTRYVGWKSGELAPTFERGEYFWNYDKDREFGTKAFQGFSRSRTEKAFSVVPETVDIKITEWCDFGCSYCYMDSTTTAKKTDAITLVKNIVKGFDHAPYQFAFGGGEPCSYKDLPKLLKVTRELGVVPNFTTAGHIFREDVIKAANKYCGGVALTYHRFKGVDFFKETYAKWRGALNIQMNIHVIADDDVIKSLSELETIQAELGGTFNIVLLAYYPNVGRADYSRVMDKKVFNDTLPSVIRKMQRRPADFRIAFSEGLLPYFNSRDIVDMQMATTQEGRFSCYIDNYGRMSTSSFSKPDIKTPTVFDKRAQELWNSLQMPWQKQSICYGCPKSSKCNAPDLTHMLYCAYSPLNKGGDHINDYNPYNVSDRRNPNRFNTQITAIGSFVTNSSSVICAFPKEVLDSPQVRAVIEKYGFDLDHVGDVWYRGSCGSIASSAAKKRLLKSELSSEEYGERVAGQIDVDDGNVYVVYGDEYTSTETIFLDLLKEVLGGELKYVVHDDFN